MTLNHKVTVDGTYTIGTDSGVSGTPANFNASVVLTINSGGELYASRSVDNTLTILGSIDNNGGTFNYGTDTNCISPFNTNDKIPSGVTATFRISTAGNFDTRGKYGYSDTTTNGGNCFGFGVERNVNTTLNGAATVLDGTITVTDATNWEVGDTIAIHTSDSDASHIELFGINAIASNVITLGVFGSHTTTDAIAFAHIDASPVSNFTSNVVIGSLSNNHIFWSGQVSTTVGGTNFQFRHVAFEYFNKNRRYGNPSWAGLNVRTNGNPVVQYEVIDDCTTWGGEGGFNQHNEATVESIYSNLAGYSSNANDAPFMCNGSIVTYNNCTLFNTTGAGRLGNTFFGLSGFRTFNDSFLSTATETGDQIAAYFYNRCTFGAASRPIDLNRPTSVYTDCEFGTFGTQGVSTALTAAADVVTNVKLINCNFVSGLTVEDQFQDVGETPAQSTFLITNKDNDLEQQELYLRSGSVIRDNSQLIRSRSSIKFNPKIANTEHSQTYNIPATSGVDTVFRFGLRYDTNFGTATPPTVEVSGLGITPQTFNAGVSANTDYEQTITVTPATTGNLTVKVAGTSANTNGNFWFSGMTASPFITWTQHYGYRYNPTVATLIVDPVVVLSESAAGALSGLAYAANNLAITAARSTSELYDWFKQYEAGNQLDPIFTSTDGNNFTIQSGDTITLGASGDITGATGKAIAFAGAGELILTDAGNNIDGLTVSGDVSVDAAIGTFTNVTVTGAMDFSVAGTYTLDGCEINEVTNSSGGAVTVNLVNGSTVTTNTGPSITLALNAPITFSAILDGTRYQLYNVTKGAELEIGTVSGGSGYVTSVDLLAAAVDANDTLSARFSYYDTSSGNVYNDLEVSFDIAALGFSSSTAQTVNDILTEIHAKGTAYEGPNITGFLLDVANIEIDSSLVQIDGQKLATWLAYEIASTNDGIRNYFDSIQALNLNNFQFKEAIQVDNTGSPAVWMGAAWTRTDGLTIVSSTSAVIQFDNALSSVPAATGSKESVIDTLLTNSNRVDALIEDSSGDRYTAKALELAAGGATAAEVRIEMDSNSTQLAGILTEVDANEAKIDTVISDTAIIKSSITGEALRLQKISAQIGDLQ